MGVWGFGGLPIADAVPVWLPLSQRPCRRRCFLTLVADAVIGHGNGHGHGHRTRSSDTDTVTDTDGTRDAGLLTRIRLNGGGGSASPEQGGQRWRPEEK